MVRRVLAGLGVAALLVVGCSASDQLVDDLTSDVERLEARNAVLATELERAIEEIEVQAEELEGSRQIADVAESDDCQLRGEQLERLNQCEHLLFDVVKYPAVDVEAPGILFIPSHGYRTNTSPITIEVMATEGSTVTIGSDEADELMSYAGGFMRYTGEVDLETGSNMISITVAPLVGDTVDLPMVVYHDPQLEQRFGMVLSTPIEGYGPAWLVGVDFVDVETGGEFGNTYDNPEVGVELLPVSPSAVAILRDQATGFGIYGDELLVLTGSEIRDVFYSFHGHPERIDGDPHTWVFSLLIDDGQVVQLEPVPIGS